MNNDDVSVRVAADGAHKHQNAGPVDVDAVPVPDFLIRFAESQRDKTMFYAALQSQQDVKMNKPVVVD